MAIIHGFIDRRILINFTVNPEDVAKILPAPFRPKIHNGKAVAGICLIRLKHMKPKGFPDWTGFSSENGAHRIAVEWEEEGQLKEGVFIPRRDSSSFFNTLIGGRLFPGKHYYAKFNVKETGDDFHIDFTSSDDTKISIDAAKTAVFPSGSIFESLENVSGFFQRGAVGYSPNGNKLEGLKLFTYQWKLQPLSVSQVSSSFFENEGIFPKGSVQFDNALLMTNLEHEWHNVANKNL